MRAFVFLFLLAACGRPLTGAEAEFIAGLQGEAFDPAPVRIVENPFLGLVERTYPLRPRVTCRERIFPPPDEPVLRARTAGMVMFNRLHVRRDYLVDDYVEGRDGALNLVAAMFFAHEMTHVWQWQNRDLTGYSPFRAAAEQFALEDPYLFENDAEIAFLDYGFEQQASLVEEYVCCRALDPDGARTGRLERLLQQAMDAGPMQSQADGAGVLLPWDGVELDGICS